VSHLCVNTLPASWQSVVELLNDKLAVHIVTTWL